MDSKLKGLIEKEQLTEKDILYLTNYLEKASEMYYNTNKKLLTDTDFDLIKDKLDEYVDLDIGAPVKKGQVSSIHSYPNLVGSLEKVNDIEELAEYYGKLVHPNEILTFKVTLKIDGNSVVGEHDKVGKPEQHLTRGRGGKGLSLSHIFEDRTLANPFGKPFGIKYEAIVKYTDFDKAIEESGKSYANPRSLVAGKLGDDDAINFKDLFTLVPIGFSFKDEQPSIVDQYRYIKQLLPDVYSEFIEPYSLEFTGTLKEFIIELEEDFLPMILSIRESLDFMIDGLVIEINDDKYRNLPAVKGKPKHAVALKFPYMEKESTVIGFEFDLSFSHTGRITPMVLFEPVSFNGAVQKRVSVANYKRFNEIALGIGSKVLIQYRNDVLSYLMPLDNDKHIEPYPFIENCPVCNSTIEILVNDEGEETLAYCPNQLCDRKINGRIIQYIKTLDIKGIKESTIDKIVQNIDVRNVSDLYLLDYDDLIDVPGFKDTTVNNILNALKEKVPMDYEILGGIGIQNFQLSKAKLLLDRITIDELLSYDDDNDCVYYKSPKFKMLFLSIEGFKDKTYDNLVEGLDILGSEVEQIIINMEENYGFEIIKTSDMNSNIDNDSPKYTFVITGTIENWANRKELTAYLKSLGHKVTGSVTKNTDYLINNDTTSTSGKNKTAIELQEQGHDIKIISEDELSELL